MSSLLGLGLSYIGHLHHSVVSMYMYNSPVERGGIIHRDESEELVETGRDSLPVDIVDNDAPPEDLVSEGGVEPGHGVAPNNKPNVLPELIRQTRDVLLLGVP